jgi:ribosomal protein S18 acetylase RimI-like enzyme
MATMGTPSRFVRVAQIADAEAIAAVQSGAWAQRFATTVPPGELPNAGDLVDQWRSLLEVAGADPRTGLVLVATEDDQVVGFLAAGPSADDDAVADECEITELAVDPAATGSGHGSRLLTAWADLSAPAGVTAGRIWLTAADDELRGLLGAAGFAPDGAMGTLDLRADGTVLVEIRRYAVGLHPTGEASDSA